MKEKIINLLNALDVPFRWVDHPAVFTVEESMKHMQDKTPAKNLLLVEKGNARKILVIMPGLQRLDSRQLAAQLGTRKLQFADEATLLKYLGVTPGSVSPFCLLFEGSTDVEVAIDESLLDEPELGFHPSDNTATIFISGSAVPKIVAQTGHALHAFRS